MAREQKNKIDIRLPVNSGPKPDRFVEDVPVLDSTNFVLLPDGSGIRPREGFEIRRNDAVGYRSDRKLVYCISNPPDIDYGDMIIISNADNNRNYIQTTEVVRTTNTIVTENPLPMPNLPPMPDPTAEMYMVGSYQTNAVKAVGSDGIVPVVFEDADTANLIAYFLEVDISSTSQIEGHSLSTDVVSLSVKQSALGSSSPDYFDVYIYRISEEIATAGPAFAGGLGVTVDTVPTAAYWKKYTAPYTSTQPPAVCAVSETQCAIKSFRYMTVYNLTTGTPTVYDLGALPNPPADPTPGNSQDSHRLHKTMDGTLICTEGAVYTNAGTNNNYVWASVIDPSDGSITRTLIQQSHFATELPWYGNKFTDVGTDNVLYAAYYKSGTSAYALANFDITAGTVGTDIEIPGVTATSIKSFSVYGDYAYLQINEVGVVEVALADGSIRNTYNFGVEGAIDYSFFGDYLPLFRNGKVWMYGGYGALGSQSGSIRAYNTTTPFAESDNDAFTELYGGEDWVDDGYAPFNSGVWGRMRIYDQFLTKSAEMDGGA